MKKKLKLSRETIARLLGHDLTQVAGGHNDPTVNTGDTFPQGSYVHQTHVYPCNKSCDCVTR